MDKVEEFALECSFLPFSSTSNDREYRLNIENSAVFRNFISVDLSHNPFEVPAVYAHLAMKLKREGYSKLVIPIFTASDFNRRLSMAGSILNFFSDVDWNTRFSGVKTAKEEVYYGCPGIILDKEFKPLLVTTMVLREASDNNISYFEAVQLNCRISYSVFERQDEVIPKTIYKKLIPLYSTTNIVSHHIAGLRFNNRRVEIKIGTGADIVFSSNTPKPSDATEDEFTRILRENIESFYDT